MDIKTWLEQAGEPVAETCFPPGDERAKLPYIYFLDEQDRGGADRKNILTTHNLTVERYSDTAEYNTKLEALFDAAGLAFTREQMWLPDPDDMYETIYTIKTPVLERTDL
ncbi:MAG: hypothetical protein PHE09_17315 [Oscillospiraceae bacterium]|nr:hypothetical protein [Oscillospiraceae bacterium]